MQSLGRWLQRDEKPIDRVLVNSGWSRHLKRLEEKLADVRDHPSAIAGGASATLSGSTCC